MPSGRYTNRITRFNRAEVYDELRTRRGAKQIKQYLTQQLHTLTAGERAQITTVQHVWTTGDRFYKLAHKYYGNTKYWWVIAWYNKKPTESHVELGETLKIPFPLYKVLAYLRNG